MSPLLERIVAMGFSDTEKVRAALVASDGDIEAAVAVLIAGQTLFRHSCHPNGRYSLPPMARLNERFDNGIVINERQ